MKNWVAFLLIAIGTGCGKKQEPAPKPPVAIIGRGMCSDGKSTWRVRADGACYSVDANGLSLAETHRIDTLSDAMDQCLELRRQHTLGPKLTALCRDVFDLGGALTTSGTTSASVITCPNKQFIRWNGENFECAMEAQ